MAKSFKNSSLVIPVVEQYLNANTHKTPSNTDKRVIAEPSIRTPGQVELTPSNNTRIRDDGCKLNNIDDDPDDDIKEEFSTGFNSELENELVYHLKTIPSGVSSAQTLKSILIDQKNVSISEIENILEQSKHIIKDPLTSKWILKTEEK